ncbi:MAG: substrate-binding domain-containing protein, partial [Firmicutes bacterium]|nr:substrate-binding domain-containing protein [Bacillota bacterium]
VLSQASRKGHWPGTLVFVAVAGEEQGLYGSGHLAKLASTEGWHLDGVLNNDIVGGNTTPGDTLQKKGSLTIRAVEMLARDEHDPGAAATILRRAAVFPEESLFVRVETANLDAGFFYSTETSGKRLRAIELPPNAALSHEITYAVAIPRAAPHPRAARIFVHYIMQGRGRAILQQAGLDTT